MMEAETAPIDRWVGRVVAAAEDEALIESTAAEVREFCNAFPAPGIRLG